VNVSQPKRESLARSEALYLRDSARFVVVVPLPILVTMGSLLEVLEAHREQLPEDLSQAYRNLAAAFDLPSCLLLHRDAVYGMHHPGLQ
jgi:hypothetical protein